MIDIVERAASVGAEQVAYALEDGQGLGQIIRSVGGRAGLTPSMDDAIVEVAQAWLRLSDRQAA